MDTSSHRSDFVHVNGVHLHYLDWGGKGDALIFLAGMGCNAHIFDSLAPRFTDKFHVLALTRRGHGESDHPEAGYELDTLVEDILKFMDTQGIEKAIFAGHSLAGVELSRINALHSERVLKLVYLDSAFYRNESAFKELQEKNPLRTIPVPGSNDTHYSIQDYNDFLKRSYPSLAMVWNDSMEEQSMHEVKIEPDGRVVDGMSDAINTAILAGVSDYAPEDRLIRVPTLSFVSFPDGDQFVADYMTEEQKSQVREHIDIHNRDWLLQNIEQFRRNVSHARIVEIPHGHHYCFLHTEELVYKEMRRFLLGA